MKPKILLLEDTDSIVEIVEKIAKELGYTVDVYTKCLPSDFHNLNDYRYIFVDRDNSKGIDTKEFHTYLLRCFSISLIEGYLDIWKRIVPFSADKRNNESLVNNIISIIGNNGGLGSTVESMRSGSDTIRSTLYGQVPDKLSEHSVFVEQIRTIIRKKIIVGFDVDDVIHDFVGSLLPHLNEHNGSNKELHEITTWVLPDIFTNLNNDYIINLVKKSDLYKNSTIHRETITLLEELSNDCEIVFLTSRYTYEDYDTIAYTHEWLKRNFHFPFSCEITGDKGVRCKERKINYFIDDSLGNVYKILRDSPETKIFIMNRPWNGESELRTMEIDSVSNKNSKYKIDILKMIRNVPRVNSLNEYIECIQ